MFRDKINEVYIFSINIFAVKNDQHTKIKLLVNLSLCNIIKSQSYRLLVFFPFAEVFYFFLELIDGRPQFLSEKSIIYG